MNPNTNLIDPNTNLIDPNTNLILSLSKDEVRKTRATKATQ